MSSKCKFTKQQLFDIGVRASSNYIVDEEIGYICPICLEIKRDIQALSKEHVPPESVGGRVICLTCQQCNSTAGHSIDAAMQERIHMQEIIMNGTKNKHVQLKIGDSAVNSEIKRSETKVDFIVNPQHNNPENRQKFMDNLAGFNKEGGELQIWYRNKFNERHAMVGYLKSAYLAMFAKFGYAYILQECLNPVRKQIENPNEEIILKWWLIRKDDIKNPKIYIFNDPINCTVVAVKQHMIVLPALSEPFDQYERIRSITEGKEKNECIGEFQYTHSFPFPTRMEMLGDWSTADQPDC